MTLFMDDGQVALHHGHVLDVLRGLAVESVQCVITSPPYWSLRAYGTEPQVWGGDAQHEHEWAGESGQAHQSRKPREVPVKADGYGIGFRTGEAYVHQTPFKPGMTFCPCGAWRGELGHEPTPQMFVQHLVEVFREVRRIMKPDATLWINLGDSYAGTNAPGRAANKLQSLPDGGRGFVNDDLNYTAVPKMVVPPGIRAKSLVLIPERFALAMADDGWIVRSRIAWCKRAPMPESVRDRPTSAWEHVWLFSKSPTYYWDAEAVREPHIAGHLQKQLAPANDRGESRQFKKQGLHDYLHPAGRNQWNYWLLSPDPEPAAHFATYPRELVRRCIAAGTSERGECPQCGKSWVRVQGKAEYITTGSQVGPKQRAGINEYQVNRPYAERKIRVDKPGEFQASCACDAGPPVPSTVLDPFVGSGTTTLVARSMLRRSIGIDLSKQYLRDIALLKNAQMALMPGEQSA